MPTVLIASDKFKGSLSSEQVGQAVAEGLADEGVAAQVLAVADGGEGTARALCRCLGGRIVEATVTDAPWSRCQNGSTRSPRSSQKTHEAGR
jgi:glycerate 2-kinase